MAPNSGVFDRFESLVEQKKTIPERWPNQAKNLGQFFEFHRLSLLDFPEFPQQFAFHPIVSPFLYLWIIFYETDGILKNFHQKILGLEILKTDFQIFSKQNLGVTFFSFIFL